MRGVIVLLASSITAGLLLVRPPKTHTILWFIVAAACAVALGYAFGIGATRSTTFDLTPGEALGAGAAVPAVVQVIAFAVAAWSVFKERPREPPTEKS